MTYLSFISTDKKTHKAIFIGIGICIFLFVIFSAVLTVKYYWIQSLPESYILIPPADITPYIPDRPGVQGVVIGGATRIRLVFSIDLTNSDPLEWGSLSVRYPLARVNITGSINTRGKLNITNVEDFGHSDAGREIRKILETWHYLPYKNGEIRFEFRFPAVDQKVTIDTRSLKPNEKFENIDIFDGQVYLINDLEKRLIGFSRINM